MDYEAKKAIYREMAEKAGWSAERFEAFCDNAADDACLTANRAGLKGEEWEAAFDRDFWTHLADFIDGEIESEY